MKTKGHGMKTKGHGPADEVRETLRHNPDGSCSIIIWRDDEYAGERPATAEDHAAQRIAAAYRPPPGRQEEDDNLQTTLARVTELYIIPGARPQEIKGQELRARRAEQEEADRLVLAGRLRNAGAPRRLAAEINEHLRPELRPALCAVRDWSRAPAARGLILSGPSGVGKSYAAGRWLRREPAGAWIDARELAAAAAWDDGGANRAKLTAWRSAPALVIDDVEAKMSETAGGALLSLLLRALDNDRRVILTTMHPPGVIFRHFERAGTNPVRRRWDSIGMVITLQPWHAPGQQIPLAAAGG